MLQCDIRQFFPSIDHAILRAKLAQRIPDAGVLWLIDQILVSGEGVLAEEYEMVWFPGDDLLAATRPRGLPIGNLTSQFWGNVYLHSLDGFIKRSLRCQGYARYVDDLLLFAHNKAILWDWRAAMVDYLAGLRLTLHPGAQPRPVTEGFPFLGFTIYPQRRRLKRRKGIHFQRRLRQRIAAYAAGEVSWRTVGIRVNNTHFGLLFAHFRDQNGV